MIYTLEIINAMRACAYGKVQKQHIEQLIAHGKTSFLGAFQRNIESENHLFERLNVALKVYNISILAELVPPRRSVNYAEVI